MLELCPGTGGGCANTHRQDADCSALSCAFAHRGALLSSPKRLLMAPEGAVVAATRVIDPDVARHRARKATAVRDGRTEVAEIADRDLRAARLADHIRKLVDAAPPLTAEQRLRLAGLLVGGAR